MLNIKEIKLKTKRINGNEEDHYVWEKAQVLKKIIQVLSVYEANNRDSKSTEQKTLL